MKSRELMQRIERAGWHAVRQAGSHITYERRGKRVVYHAGRPQEEIGKNRLRDVVAAFALERIEREMAAEREQASADVLAKAERHAATAVAQHAQNVPHLNGELDYGEMRVLYAQLHKDHGYDVSRLAKAVGIPFKKLSEYMHGQRPTLQPYQLDLLRRFFTTEEVKLGLTRDRQALRDRGWGVRTGLMNSPDPRLVEIAEALKATGKKYSELDEQIFGGRSIVGSVVRGDVKRVFPANMAILEAWYAKQRKPVEQPTPRMRTETVEPIHPPTKAVQRQGAFLADYEVELAAVRDVVAAVSALPHKVALRVLAYATQRLEEEG